MTPSYIFAAPKLHGDFNTVDGPALMFTTEPGSLSLIVLDSLSVAQKCDASVGDSASGRFAIRIGASWYVSDLEWRSTTSPSSFTTYTFLGIDFTDGDTWRALTVSNGGTSTTTATGEITLGSVVGGKLTGHANAFGVYLENGNDGDHARIDDFIIARKKAGTIIVLS